MKLTPTMEHGLRVMAKTAYFGNGKSFAHPTETTGMALEKRGLVEYVDWTFRGKRYRITDAGRAWLAENGGEE